MSKSRLIIIIFAIAVLFLYIFFVVSPVAKGYEFFTGFAADLLNKKQRIDAIRNTFPIDRFITIQRIIYIAGVFLILLFALSIKYSATLHQHLSRITFKLKSSGTATLRTFKKASPTAKILFSVTLLYLIVHSIYYMLQLPFIHDEAYTISNFVLPGPLASTTFYPYPNNHILFSLLSYLFSFLPIQPEVAFRLPSLIAVVITCFVLFRLLLLCLPSTIASFGVLVFVCMFPVMSYSVFARGYSLVFLFTALSVYSLIKAIEKGSRFHRVLLILFSILGLYTVPSFMYPFAAIHAVYFFYGLAQGKRKVMVNAIISGLTCGFCTLLLYLPVIITSGGWDKFKKIVYFGYDDSFPISKIADFINFVYSIQFFEQSFLIVSGFAFIALTAAISIRKIATGKAALTDTVLFWVCLLGFLAPMISFLIQGKMVPARTHSYVAIFFAGYTFISIKISVIDQWKQYAYYGIAVFFVAMNIVFAHKNNLLKGEEYSDRTADLFADKMLEAQQKNDTCYTFDIFYLASFQLKYAISKKQLTVYQSYLGSPSSASFDYSKNYNWIVTANNSANVNKDSLKLFYLPAVVRDDATLWRKRR